MEMRFMWISLAGIFAVILASGCTSTGNVTGINGSAVPEYGVVKLQSLQECFL